MEILDNLASFVEGVQVKTFSGDTVFIKALTSSTMNLLRTMDDGDKLLSRDSILNGFAPRREDEMAVLHVEGHQLKRTDLYAVTMSTTTGDIMGVEWKNKNEGYSSDYFFARTSLPASSVVLLKRNGSCQELCEQDQFIIKGIADGGPVLGADMTAESRVQQAKQKVWLTTKKIEEAERRMEDCTARMAQCDVQIGLIPDGENKEALRNAYKGLKQAENWLYLAEWKLKMEEEAVLGLQKTLVDAEVAVMDSGANNYDLVAQRDSQLLGVYHRLKIRHYAKSVQEDALREAVEWRVQMALKVPSFYN